MAEVKKVTKRERFEQIKALLADNKELVEFCDHELELLAKKNASDKKATPNQVANEGIKDTIVEALTANGDKMTVTDIQKSLDTELSNQKISSLLRQLVADGKVARVEDKRKAYFTVA